MGQVSDVQCSDIIHGKLDQKNGQLEIDYAIGRDIRPEDIDVIVNCLQDWCSACEKVLSSVETQIHRANSEKNNAMVRQMEIEQEVVLYMFLLLFLCFLVYFLDIEYQEDLKNSDARKV